MSYKELNFESNFRDGEPDGKHKFYYDNGKLKREENYVISHFLFPKSIWNTTKMPSKALCCAGKRDWQSEISLKLERWALRRFKGHSSKSATAVVVVVGSK